MIVLIGKHVSLPNILQYWGRRRRNVRDTESRFCTRGPRAQLYASQLIGTRVRSLLSATE